MQPASSAARLIEVVGERGGAVEVTYTRDVALGLLASEEGRAFSGRAGRLVTPVELGFIMEDMKTSGLKQRRLREMLKFFYRNWTELAGGADDDDRWLIPGEEADTHALLKDVLRFTGGILEPEASAMAVRFLLACPEVLASAQRAHVLVDDYQMHSRASQHLANLLARDSVIVAADPAAVVEVFDSYPYGEGIGEFTQANEGCERIVLNESYACAAAARAASRLRASLDAGAAPLGDAEAESDAPSPSQSASSATSGTTATPTVPDRAAIAASFTALKATDPAAEMASVADAVQTALEAGADPSSIYVLAFHPAWERRVARALEARGIATATPVRGRVAAGDYRDLDRCAAGTPARRPSHWSPTRMTPWRGAPGAASATTWPTARYSPICAPRPTSRARISSRCSTKWQSPRPKRDSRAPALAASWTPTARAAPSSSKPRVWKATS